MCNQLGFLNREFGAHAEEFKRFKGVQAWWEFGSGMWVYRMAPYPTGQHTHTHTHAYTLNHAEVKQRLKEALALAICEASWARDG